MFRIIRAVMTFVGAVCIFLLTMLVTASVVARYVFNKPFTFAEEIAVYLLVVAIFTGLAYTLKEEGHIKVSILYDRLSTRVQRVLRRICYFLGVLFLVLMFAGSVHLVAVWQIRGTRATTVLGTPMVIIGIIILIGVVCFLVQMIKEAYACFREPVSEVKSREDSKR